MGLTQIPDSLVLTHFRYYRMLSHYRKEAYWPSRHACAGDSIESVNN
jgi:hypothetical protein